MQVNNWDLIIVGGGAAGYFAAINCAELQPGLKILILEASKMPLSKVKVSGGGRCNITNIQSQPKLLAEGYPRGKRELIGPFHKFNSSRMIEWLKDRGLETKTEPDGRIFPTSNSSQSVIDLFQKLAIQKGVKLQTSSKLVKLLFNNPGFTLFPSSGPQLSASSILLCTGNHPSGYQLAASLGHKIIKPVPALFSFKTNASLLNGLMGLSFKKAILSSPKLNKKFRIEGPMLITHWGLSGPAILKFSSFVALELHQLAYRFPLRINFLGISNMELAKLEILNLLKENSGKQIGKTAPQNIPKRFWENLLLESNISPVKSAEQLNKKEIQLLVNNLTQFEIQIHDKGPFKEEFVTAGGVHLKEVHFNSMESKLVPNCYFAGEILNIDGITGGYNFQNAWTTAYLCAQDVSKTAL